MITMHNGYDFVRATYLAVKEAGSKVGSGEVRGAPGGGTALVNLDQLCGECVLSGHLGQRLSQDHLDRAQGLEGSEARVIGPDVFVEDQVEVVELLAIDEERVQAERLVNLQHSDGVLRFGDVRE